MHLPTPPSSMDFKETGVYPDSKVHRRNMGPTWVLSAPDGPHVGPTKLAIRVGLKPGWGINFDVKDLRPPVVCLCYIQSLWLPWTPPGFSNFHTSVWLLKVQVTTLRPRQNRHHFADDRDITKSISTLSATNISSNMIWFFQLHDAIKIKSNHTGINFNHNNIVIRSHIVIYNNV